MPKYMVTLKENASPEQLENAKKDAESKGGKIVHEYTLTKGFMVEFPEDHVSVLESNEHIEVEKDSVVTTQ